MRRIGSRDGGLWGSLWLPVGGDGWLPGWAWALQTIERHNGDDPEGDGPPAKNKPTDNEITDLTLF
jgi:hypothetical protein